jgi:hypothetical protein
VRATSSAVFGDRTAPKAVCGAGIGPSPSDRAT